MAELVARGVNRFPCLAALAPALVALEESSLRTALDEKLDLTARAYRALADDKRLDVPWEPQLSVVAFRLRDGDDAANQRLLERVNATQRTVLSSTRIDDRYMLRMCVLSHRTHAEHVDETVEEIRAAI